jgi:hypothetical protein
MLLVPESKVVHDGKQNLKKVDPKKYEDLGIETKIINPNFPNALVFEKIFKKYSQKPIDRKYI